MQLLIPMTILGSANTNGMLLKGAIPFTPTEANGQKRKKGD